MNDEELSAKIRELDGKDFPFYVKGFEDSGKAIPYIGWFWRTVYFDSPEFTLGYFNGPNDPPFVGFMQSNKWGYPEFAITPEQRVELRNRLEAVACRFCEKTCQELFDYMQTLAPEWVRNAPKTVLP